MYFCFFSKSLSPLLLPNTVLRPKLLHVNDFAVLKGQDGERRRHLGVEHVPLHGAVLPLAKVLKIRLVERRSVEPPVLMARQDTPELVTRCAFFQLLIVRPNERTACNFTLVSDDDHFEIDILQSLLLVLSPSKASRAVKDVWSGWKSKIPVAFPAKWEEGC